MNEFTERYVKTTLIKLVKRWKTNYQPDNFWFYVKIILTNLL